jgi:hypothetical protein
MTAAVFWGSTLAQLHALMPPDAPTASADTGTGDDLLALARMQER